MPEQQIVDLPGRPAAATSYMDSVWIVARGRLAAYDTGGGLRWDADAPAAVTALAAARGGMLVAAVEPGGVAWLDVRSGAVLARQTLGGDVTVGAGGGAAWAIDRRSEQAWRLEPHGSRAGPVPIPGVHQFAVDGERIWWTCRRDTKLRDGQHVVDLGAEAAALVACAGSIWISTPGALRRVGAWSGELGPPVPGPAEMATHLDCADGMLAGGSERTLFVLDPRIDADARVLDVTPGGPLGFLLATQSHVWAIAAGRAQAHVVAVRPA